MGAAIGAEYGFLALETMGLIAVALVVVLSPFLSLIANSKMLLGRSALALGLRAGFVVGFVIGWVWMLGPLRLSCQPPSCNLATTPLEDLQWGLGFLAVPFLLIAAALSLRQPRSPRPILLAVSVFAIGMAVLAGARALNRESPTNRGGFSAGAPTPTPVVPAGFYLPLKCRLVGVPVIASDGTTWRFDCGAENANAAAALAPALREQGWMFCGDLAGRSAWGMGAMTIFIEDGVPGSLPTLHQIPERAAPCP